MESYYKILGVSDSANQLEIKRAFKRLAVRYHPDKNPDSQVAEENFKRINTAYQVLSDESSKAQYDLRRMNREYEQQFRANPTARSTTAKHRDPRYQQRKPPFGAAKSTTPRYSKQEDEKKGIMWTVSMFAIIIVLFSIGFSINAYLNHLDAEAIRLSQEELQSRLKKNMSAAAFDSLIHENGQILRTKGGYSKEMYDFDLKVKRKLKARAHEAFHNKDYELAMSFFQLWQRVMPDDDIDLTSRMIETHKHLGQYEEAFAGLRKMILNEESEVFAYAEMGAIYANYLKDFPKAIACYDTASNYILAGYKQQFGDAYAIMLDPRRIPELQYEVYLEKGKLHLAQREYREAILACSWASFIRSQKHDAYFIKGNAELGAGNRSQACQDWQQAVSLGNLEASSALGLNCR